MTKNLWRRGAELGTAVNQIERSSKRHLMLCLMGTLLLASCGGGGSDSGPPPPVYPPVVVSVSPTPPAGIVTNLYADRRLAAVHLGYHLWRL